MDNLTVRGQEAEIRGIAPHKSIDLDVYSGQHIPKNWDITGVTGDILMVEPADEAGDGEYIDRGGVLVNSNMTKAMWRVGKIVLTGPGASSQATVGRYVMWPNDKGLPLTKMNGHNYHFINEERIFCFVEPKK